MQLKIDEFKEKIKNSPNNLKLDIDIIKQGKYKQHIPGYTVSLNKIFDILHGIQQTSNYYWNHFINENEDLLNSLCTLRNQIINRTDVKLQNDFRRITGDVEIKSYMIHLKAALFSDNGPKMSEEDILDYLCKVDNRLLQFSLSGSTILHKACEFGCVNVVRYLLNKREMDPNIVNKETGNTPLFLVARANMDPQSTTDIVDLLLENGASLGLKNNNKSTALFEAVCYNNESVVERLLSKTRTRQQLSLFSEEKNISELLSAAIRGNFKIVKLLVDAGANVNTLDNQKLSPLYHAIVTGKNLKCAHYLLANGAYAGFTRQDTGQTILMYASHLFTTENDPDELISFMIEVVCRVKYCKWEDLLSTDIDGNTALHHLWARGIHFYKESEKNTQRFENLIKTHKVLCALGADPQLTNNNSKTCLQGIYEDGLDINRIDVSRAIPLFGELIEKETTTVKIYGKEQHVLVCKDGLFFHLLRSMLYVIQPFCNSSQTKKYCPTDYMKFREILNGIDELLYLNKFYVPQSFKTQFGEIKSKLGHTVSATELLGENDIYDKDKKVILKKGNVYKYYWPAVPLGKLYTYIGWYEECEFTSHGGCFNVFEIHDSTTQETITDPEKISYLCGGRTHTPVLEYLAMRAKRYHSQVEKNKTKQRKIKMSDNATLLLTGMNSPEGNTEILGKESIGRMRTPEAIETLRKQFYVNAQKIIETYYLLPTLQNNQGRKRKNIPTAEVTIGGRKIERAIKANLRDGLIERPIHGGMHVARVQFWVLILNQIFKNTASDYHQSVMDSFKTQFGLDESEVITLTRYAALFHDSARQHEAADKWDKESAENTYQYLVDNKIDDKTARLFQHAAEFKDKPEKFNTFLQSNNLDEHRFAFHYIRKLIAMSDCLDIMRCVGRFEFNNILDHISDITALNEKQKSELETCLIQLSKDIYDVLVKQKDMLNPCTIISNNRRIYPESLDIESQHSLQVKTGFEHASDVCKTIGSSLQKKPNLATLLKNEAKHFQQHDLQPAPQPTFNPYIHGSNSCVLALLARTEYQLMSPMGMMDEFNAAPMCGERGNSLYGGGLDNLTPGKWVCWGLLQADGLQEYGLKTIITKYASQSPLYFDLGDELITNATITGFKKINMILIHLIAKFQTGENAQAISIISEEVLPTLNAFIQFHYLLLLMGMHVSTDKEKYNDFKRTYRLNPYDNPITNAIVKLFTLPNIVQRIQDRTIDFKAIYEKENPTEADLTEVVDFLNEPLLVDLLRGEAITEESFSFFCRADADSSTSTPNQPSSYYEAERLLINTPTYQIEWLINDCITGKQSTPQWATQNQEYILANLRLLQKKRDKVKSLLSANIKPLSDEDLSFTENPFPLMFVTENEKNIYLTDLRHQEYRSFQPLTIGDDITMLATDTDENRNTLLGYLKKHNLNNVSVVLFEDLKQSLTSKKAPTGIKVSDVEQPQKTSASPTRQGLFTVPGNKETTTAKSGSDLGVTL